MALFHPDCVIDDFGNRLRLGFGIASVEPLANVVLKNIEQLYQRLLVDRIS
jgi:hypothetical protein